MRMFSQLLVLVAFGAVGPLAADTTFSGHIKYQWQGAEYPGDSLFEPIVGDHGFDQAADVRLKLNWRKGRWGVNADYQFIGQHGDLTEANRDLPGLAGLNGGLPEDDARLVTLSWQLTDDGRSAATHRFDRLHLDYIGDRTVVRVGRQAVSWGNGLLYNPLDFLNPFDPATVDKEYKTGDDMVYGQYLRDSGDDIQALWVGRRNPITGRVEDDVQSTAVKYHGFIGAQEYDVLIARHFDDWVLGIGGITNLGAAVWRGDISLTYHERDTSSDTELSAVTSLSYSWVSFGKNVNGVLEYFYNGFGESGGDYSGLAANEALLERVSRGELFTLGQHYLAASAAVEVTPLVNITPNVFVNLNDPSALFQLVGQYDMAQNWQLLGAVNIPIGPNGSEFGGIDSGVPDQFLSNRWSVFAQVAWYF